MSATPTRQTRSARTLQRILDACDALLADRNLEDLTMIDIAREAGVSVGNLYNRFADRGALVAHLVEREQSALLVRLETNLAAMTPEEDLGERLRSFTVLLCRELPPARPILVGLLSRGASTMPAAPVSGAAARSDALVDAGVRWLTEGDAALAGEEAREACRFAVAAIAFQLQFDLLYGTATRMFGDALVDRIAAQAHSAIQTQAPGAVARRPRRAVRRKEPRS